MAEDKPEQGVRDAKPLDSKHVLPTPRHGSPKNPVILPSGTRLVLPPELQGRKGEFIRVPKISRPRRSLSKSKNA